MTVDEALSRYPLIELWIRKHTRLTNENDIKKIVTKAVAQAARFNAPRDAVFALGAPEKPVYHAYKNMAGPGRLATEHMMRERCIWMTKDYIPMRIADMKTTNIRYSIAKILFNPPVEGWRADYILLLTSELARRGDGYDKQSTIRPGDSEAESGGCPDAQADTC